uniref:asparagine synthase (glutamine-hydrolyzing) n=1 Tax=viral metagenome TaxID=1070528 RepID=A0A6C0HSZ0_9ZZZZ
MCGIFAILNNISQYIKKEFIIEQFQKGKSRGPDDSNILDLYIMNCMLGFHRLSINGLTKNSNQPFYIENIFLICNGEIYNYKELYQLLDIEPTTESDCEVIIHLYLQYGMEQTIRMLDGEFSFILIDTRISLKKMYIGRDPYGVRPLYMLYSNTKLDEIHGFSSEVKQLSEIQKSLNNDYIITHFPPGTLSLYENYTIEYNSSEIWRFCETIKYHNNLFSFHSLYTQDLNIYENIREYLISAVVKRCKCSERPIACLLSGGLDSSLIASIAKQYTEIETFSIGFANSEDLRMARKVADHIKSKHHEVIITKEEYLEAIPIVIQAIESYDTTTVRASVGNYLVAKYIASVSDAKVILNGDGADELCGGYLYMHKCPNALEFDKETRRLLSNIHYFDVLRSDKSIASNGLEARTPFLDLHFVQYYLSINPTVRFPKGTEKLLLRSAFKDTGLLPDEILWRRKEAFSDGVTVDSIVDIIHSHVKDLDLPLMKVFPLPKSQEEKYYRKIFEEYYSNAKIIPHFWKPKFVEDIDPSARALDIY